MNPVDAYSISRSIRRKQGRNREGPSEGRTETEYMEQAWNDMYAFRYGDWRTYVMTVIYKYLDCSNCISAKVYRIQ